MRQVTHALLTRPPLNRPEQAPASIVRLACVKHAASVHPEPGSNSHVKKFFPASFIWHCLLLIRVASRSFDRSACSWISQFIFLKILEFSGLHYCLFVKDQWFFVAVVLSGNSDILSCPLSFVNNFFDFFKSFFQPKNLRFCGGFSYYHIVSCFVNNFLHLFFKAFTMA